MAKSPFIRFAENAIRCPDVFPAIRYRLAWLEFRGLFNSLINGPVWKASPPTFEAWVRSTVPSSKFGSVRRWLSGEDEEIAGGFPPEMPIAAAFAALERYHDLIRHGLKGEIGPCAVRSVSPSRSTLGPLPVTFRRATAVRLLCETLLSAPPSISSAMIHGSLADGLVAEGFSDADVLCFVASPIDGQDTFWEAAQWLFQLNHRLFAINPCMHHGPMLAFADEANSAAEASLPSAILRNGFWLAGELNEISYHDGWYEAVAVLKEFEFYFERHHLFVPDIRNAFDALWWTSSVLLLPLLLHQATTGQSIYKRLCLAGPLTELTEPDRAAVRRISEIRTALGRWIVRRLPAEEAVDQDANPGMVVATIRNQLKMTADDVRSVGLCDARLTEARELWARIRSRVLEIGLARLGSNHGVEPIRWELSRPVTALPHPLRSADYDEARKLFVARCRSMPEVVAVFEFGEVGCPGLSDLDLCVVLDNSFLGVPAELRTQAFPPEIAYILDHDPLFVSAEMAPQLGAFFPLFSTRQLYGKAISMPVSEKFPLPFQVAAITSKNLVKYPADLDWLLSRDQLNVRTLLAFVHSAKHVGRCLTKLGLEVPVEILATIALDEKSRSQFRNQVMPDGSDIFAMAETCMAGCQPLQNALAEYWIFAARNLECNRGAVFPPTGRSAAAWIRSELRTRNVNIRKGGSGPTLYPLIAEYLEAKKVFVEFECGRNRIPSVYVDDSSHEATHS